jgi:hypothetical protein
MKRSFLAHGLAFILAAATVAACQSARPTPSPSPAPTATPTASPSPKVTPQTTPSPTPSASLDPNATPTPLPTGAPGAYATVQNYEDALLAGNYAGAWALLGITTRGRWGASLDKFTQDRAAFLAKAGRAYTLALDPTNTLPLNEWTTGTSWGPGIDLKNAHLVTVHWAALSPDAGLEIWVVNPGKTGGWLLYEAV